MGKYSVKDGKFVIEGFDRTPAFSGFLPGLTGEDGIPMWAFYCNRGQAIASLGINNKSEAIIEFNPACIEYENTELKGYRTFIRVNGKIYEPFRYRGDAKRTMTIRKNGLGITEESPEFGLKINVDYYILPKEPLGALVRRVKLENTGDAPVSAEVLDGVARIIPRGISLGFYKDMGNLYKSWTEVRNIENNAPIFSIRSSTVDSAKIDAVKDGYFYACVHDGKTMPFICDSDVIFGYDTSLSFPTCFEEKALKDIPVNEEIVNKIPCAFTPMEIELAPGANTEWVSYLGHSSSEAFLNRELNRFTEPGFASRKMDEAKELCEELTSDVRTETAYPAFDKYIEQCYLDNFLRGGYPVTIGPAVLYLYSRKHGDPERDYNFFTIDGEYYSQGNGNFRDVCQNRRNDVFFCPELKDYNIKNFASLIQLDGYNPLEIRPATFEVKKENRDAAAKILEEACSDPLDNVLSRRFKPGEVFREITLRGFELKKNPKDVMSELLPLCEEHNEAGAGEGYWSDHWDYIMDLIDSYTSVYPDKTGELMATPGYRFYDSDILIRPRKDTYSVEDGIVRRYDFVYRSDEKASEEGFNKGQTNWKKTKDGKIVEVSLAAKLFTLLLVKMATFDPYGMGIETEGGKPGWNDAMNGLPAMFAGSMPETYELKRLASFLSENIPEEGFQLPAEVFAFFVKMKDLISKYPIPDDLTKEGVSNKGSNDFKYWDGAAAAREEYRETIYKPLSGDEVKVSSGEANAFVKASLNRITAGIEKAAKTGDIAPTYFTYDAVDYEEGKVSGGKKDITVTGFVMKTLPAFLEGPARLLSGGSDDAASMHEKVLSSGLYDKKLHMFKTSESIEKLSIKYGRIRAFTAGWLERESVFLHMEYKYLYALLKNGLYDEFYTAVKDAFIPFLDPAVYGRSIFENSSFIASSANPDENVHGRGYVARLSGSTTEVMSMWIRMFMGERLFYMEDGKLKITLAPVLPADFFDKNGMASFTFMAQCRVVYHNTTGKNTYGKDAAKITKLRLLTTHGETVEKMSDTFCCEDALNLRNGGIVRIDAYLE